MLFYPMKRVWIELERLWMELERLWMEPERVWIGYSESSLGVNVRVHDTLRCPGFIPASYPLFPRTDFGSAVILTREPLTEDERIK